MKDKQLNLSLFLSFSKMIAKLERAPSMLSKRDCKTSVKLVFLYHMDPVVVLEGFQGVRSNPLPPPPPILKYPMKMRPNYFIFMGYLGKTRYNQQSEPPHLYMYEPPSRNPGSAIDIRVIHLPYSALSSNNIKIIIWRNICKTLFLKRKQKYH